MSASGAWVVDVKLFSNMSACFNFEVPRSHTAQLRGALAATGLHLSKESDESFASLLEHCESDAGGWQEPDIAGTLQITFIHNEPDLRIEVPQIPG